jgi:hypothetical protein
METEKLEFKLKAEALLIQIKEERKKRTIEDWVNSPKINNQLNIPELQKVNKT